MRTAIRQLGTVALVAGAYVAAARLGFRVASVAEQVTLVWAPTGIAQAVLLVWGPGLWPAVWIGAWIANASTSAPIWTAFGVATGNALEALTAVWGLRRLTFDPALRRTRDVAAFIALAAVAGPAISATVGVTTLAAGHVQPWGRFWPLWSDWVLGDALGALVVGPVILTLSRAQRWRRRWRSAETIALVGCVLVATEVVFGVSLPAASESRPLAFVVFPIVMLAAVRLGQPATAIVVFSASLVATWNTALGTGPFADASLHQRLLLLQTFMGVLASSGLLLSAAVTERHTAERRRAAVHAVGQVLAGAREIERAAPDVLAALCGALEWRLGVLWWIDRDLQRLQAASVWPPDDLSSFAQRTRTIQFARGEGLPGRVWKTGEAAWIEDVVRDGNFPRGPMASTAGLRGAFGFPIKIGDEVVGVIECFRPEVAAPDPDLMATMAGAGQQIGQFVERSRVEAIVRENESRIRAILDTALDAIISMDHRGVITDFNAAAERIFGHPRDQAVGRELADLIIPPHLREPHRAGLQRYLSTGVGPFIDRRVEATAVAADGREFPVEISITAVRTERFPTFTGYVRDVTDRVRRETERHELLERERVARSEAETANRAKDEFLATLSHELRTPLTAVVGWTRMLLTGAVAPENVQRALEVIDRNAQAQIQLVGDLLDVSRIITGGLRLEMASLDLRSVVQAGVEVVRPAAETKRLALELDVPADPVRVVGDAARLQQIVWNLLSNAVKFTPLGGHVRIDLVDDDARARIRIEDTGPGVALEFLPYVFDRFRQADSSSTRQHGGLGLGLAIVRHLTELHGGTVSVENRRDRTGTVFVVDLPKRRGPTLPEGGPAEASVSGRDS